MPDILTLTNVKTRTTRVRGAGELHFLRLARVLLNQTACRLVTNGCRQRSNAIKVGLRVIYSYRGSYVRASRTDMQRVFTSGPWRTAMK